MATNSSDLHRDARADGALSPVERACVSMLRADGWSTSACAMTFEVSENAILRATNPPLAESLIEEVREVEEVVHA